METDTGAPSTASGYSFICSLRDGGSKLVVHGPECGLGGHIEESFMDKEKCMAWGMLVANQVDCDFKMAGQGIRQWRAGHMCEK